MADENDWIRLTKTDAYVGGAIRDRDERGRLVHRRISLVRADAFTVSFRFDRVAVRVAESGPGAWRELPLDGNDFLWFPAPLMPVAFADDGVVRPGSAEMPSFIEAIYPRTALPADSPAFADPMAN